VAGVEDLHLAPDAELLDPLGSRPEHVRSADVDQAALAEVEAAAVQRADVGEQLLDVLEPLDPAGSRTRSPPMPAVVLITTSTSLARIRSTASR
jgi:hypothetical protein